MKFTKFAFIVASSLAAANVFAQDSTQRSETVAPAKEAPTGIGVSHWSLRPTAGGIFYGGRQEFTGGILTDFNLLNVSGLKIGPAIGALYSSPVANNFFGNVTSNSSNQYIFQLPANLKAMVEPLSSKRLAIGAHGGANIVYSSSGMGGAFGGTNNNITTTSGGASWDVHPNVGADLDYALSQNIDVSLRPDWTLMPDFNLFTATLGIGLRI